jgi:hypothetical protein
MTHRIVFSSVVLSLFLFVSASQAQEDHSVGVTKSVMAENSIYLELGGNALLYSINFDRMISPDMGARIGIGYMGLSTGTAPTDGPDHNASVSVLLVPATFNFFVSSHDGNHVGSSKLELGLGVALVDINGDFGGTTFSGAGVGGTATIGYRYQPYDGGFLFRIGFTPVFASSTFFPWGGISFGLTF